MQSRRPLLALAAAICLAFAAPAPAHAQDDAEVTRLLTAGHSLKWNHTPAGKTERYGHAEVLVGTNADKVRGVVSNFAGYKDLVPDKFSSARVIAKEAGNTDVQMQIPMKGLLRSLNVWQILRFGPVREVGKGVFQLQGKFVRGANIKDADLVFTWREVGANTTLLKMDLLMQLTIPSPQAMVDEELRDAAAQAIEGVLHKAQGTKDPVTAIQ
jgi:hypothetical protein